MLATASICVTVLSNRKEIAALKKFNEENISHKGNL